MKRTEPTVSVRIRESDYESLLVIMQQENIKTITEAITWAIAVAALEAK